MAKKEYKIISDRRGRKSESTGTLDSLVRAHGYSLQVGNSWDRTINRTPKTIKALITNLNKSAMASSANGDPATHYTLGEATTKKKLPDSKLNSVKFQLFNDERPVGYESHQLSCGKIAIFHSKDGEEWFNITSNIGCFIDHTSKRSISPDLN